MDDGPIPNVAKGASEALLLAMAVLAPWAFGSVDAWAELALGGGVVLLALLGLFTNHGPGSARRWLCLPSLALGGLALLALTQAVSLPTSVVKVLAPAMESLRGGLVPNLPQVVLGDPGDPVAPPSSTLSLEPEASMHAAAALGGAWILFQAVLGLGNGHASHRRFGLAMVGNAALLSLFSIAQALMWDGKIYGIRRTEIGQRWYTGGPFVGHNHLAAYLNLGLGFALGLLIAKSKGNAKGRGRRLVPAYATSLIVVGVLASHSRGGFLAMAAAALVTLVALRGGAWRGLAVMAAMISLFLLAIGSESAVNRVGTILDSGSSGFNGRLEVWGVAVRTWWSHPLVGTGLGCFVPATIPRFERDRGVYFSHAENEPLQMLVEGGIIGLGLALMGVAGIARFGLKALFVKPSGRDRAAIIGGLAGGLALCVQSLGDFALRIPGVAVAALILAAHLCRLGLHAGIPDAAPRQSQFGRSPIANRLVAGLMVFLSLVVCWHGFRRAKAEAYILSAGLPAPGSIIPDFACGRVSPADLERMRLGLEGAPAGPPGLVRGALATWDHPDGPLRGGGERVA